jgi:phosphohistidine phosphatase SixA
VSNSLSPEDPAGPSAEERRELAERILGHAVEVARGLSADPARAAADARSEVGAGRTLLEGANAAMRVLVQDARRAGSTWQAVGEAMGTTRQAAQQRFGERGPAQSGDESNQRATRWALMVLNWWHRGQLKELRATFEPDLAAQLDELQLGAAWALVEAAEGPLLSQGKPAVAHRGSLVLVDIPLQFERAPMKARVALAEGGAVAGLFLLFPEAL